MRLSLRVEANSKSPLVVDGHECLNFELESNEVSNGWPASSGTPTECPATVQSLLSLFSDNGMGMDEADFALQSFAVSCNGLAYPGYLGT